jgi:hypothetical protein
MNMDNYIADVTYAGSVLLEDWEWLLGDKYSLWFVTKFGDAFVKDKSGSVAWLDVTRGAITAVASDEGSFLELAKVPDNFERWFMREVVDGQADLGVLPGKNQCISFIKPPILGGELSPDNLELTNAAVHLSIAGQIHRQVKDLPPGTKISGVSVEQPTSKKPWWKLW